jgi:hypothetical protein
MSTAHQRYHSDFKSEYLNGRLSEDIVKKIPRSTRQRWRQEEQKQFWMPVPIHHNVIDELTIKKLKAENKMLRAEVRAYSIW